MNILTCVWGGAGNDQSPYSTRYVSGDRVASRVIAEGLRDRGHRVHVVSLSRASETFTVNGVVVHHVRNPVQAPPRPWSPEDHLALTPRFLEAYVDAIARVSRQEGSDLLMARTVHLTATGALLAARAVKLPLVTTVAERDFLAFFSDRVTREAVPGVNFPPPPPPGFAAWHLHLTAPEDRDPRFADFNRHHRCLVRSVLTESAGLILLSPHLLRDVRAVAPAHASSRVIPDGVDLEAFQPGPRDPADPWGLSGRAVVVCVARAEPFKRQDVVVRAIPRVVAAHPDAVFVFAGTGIYEPLLRGLATGLGVGEHARFVGYVPHAAVPTLLRWADVALCPTDSEGLPLVLLEAMAAGKPVVTSACPPYDAIVQPLVNGLVVPNAPDAFAEALLRLLGDPGLRARLGDGGRRTAAEYPWERTVARTADFLAHLAGEQDTVTEGLALPGRE